MFFKVFFVCAIATVHAGYLGGGLRYAAPVAYGFAAPAIARVDHLAPAVASVHRTELYTAPIARTSLVAPAVHSVVAAPVVRSNYFGHGFGYGSHFGYARALPLGYAGAYRAGW
ncbi:cuticle protein 10.6-like [Photinus pyralis]|uniref:cuticle protein 10.6-like n=1 Tax=Photinus pyralis TaxID=7054 RepID=UPI0012671A89|nr:cuticle protein 10.6-like [Photinus pyralis]